MQKLAAAKGQPSTTDCGPGDRDQGGAGVNMVGGEDLADGNMTKKLTTAIVNCTNRWNCELD